MNYSDREKWMNAAPQALGCLGREGLDMLSELINVEKDVRLLWDILYRPALRTEKAQNLLERLIIARVRALCGSYRKIRHLPHNLVFVLNPDAE